MPYINVDEAYILDNTGLQVDNSVDYANANSNRNLLDNPFFRINQRNVSGTITSGYIADRWTLTYGSGGVTASRTADSITVAPVSSSSHGDIAQRMEKDLFDYLLGKTVTASVMRSDYSIVSGTFEFVSGTAKTVGTDLDGNLIYFRAYQSSSYQDAQFWKWNTAGTFRAVKLELGSYSTLINDTPPDYAEELEKCRFYFRRYKNLAASAVNALVGGCVLTNVSDYILDGEMRNVAGTTTYSGSITVNGQAATNVLTYNRGGQITLRINTGGGLTQYQVAIAAFAAGAYIDISHDL